MLLLKTRLSHFVNHILLGTPESHLPKKYPGKLFGDANNLPHLFWSRGCYDFTVSPAGLRKAGKQEGELSPMS